MSNDLSNQEQNVDVVIKTEKLSPKQLWISIGLLSLLGTLFLLEGNIEIGVSAILAAFFVWWTLR